MKTENHSVKLLLRLAAAALICSTASIPAATWYVDNAAAGSNNGTSWANAWTSFSSIGWSSIAAGDTIYISGGSSSKTYYETLSVQRSGTSANRLTIKVGQVAGHNGKVLIDAQYTRNACVDLGSSDYVTLSGDNGTGSTNLVMKNSGSSSDRYTGTGLASSGPNGETIEYCEVADCNNGLGLNGGSANIVRSCYIHGVRGDRAIIMAGADVYDDNQVYNCEIQLNYANSGYGPDGIQGGSGISVHHCHIYAGVGTIVGAQHMDATQPIGNHWKIYNNVIENMGNACIEGGSVGSVWGYYLVYNNVFIANFGDSGYKRGFEFSPNSAITSVTDIYVFNNTFVDLTWRAFHWVWSGYTPTVRNVVVENNIWYDCGRNDTSRLIDIEGNVNTSQASYTIDYNEANAGSGGTIAMYVSGTSFTQAHPRTGAPSFVSYAVNSTANDYHLKSTDTACKDLGIDASAWIPAVDKDGVTRPQGSAWDLGAFEYASGGGGGNTNPVITVTPASLDFGSVTLGAAATLTFSVQNTGAGTLTGNATVSTPFSIVSGGSYSLGAGQSQTVTVRFSPTLAANTNQTVTFTGAGGTTRNVTGIGLAPLSGLTFEAESGVITAPFVASSGSISQASQTTVTTGGRAAYSFTVTNAGLYVVQGLVNAPNDAANSFYVNIDAEPTDPYMVWQIPLTTGFQNQIVSWQGNGTYDAPQFVPNFFNLNSGVHQLIIRGREANTQLDRISILQVPNPPTYLYVLTNAP